MALVVRTLQRSEALRVKDGFISVHKSRVHNQVYVSRAQFFLAAHILIVVLFLLGF